MDASQIRKEEVADSYAEYTWYVWTEAESVKKKLRTRMPNTPDMCGQKSNPQRKIWGLKNIRIPVRRVEGASMHFQYHINALREYFFGYGNVTSRREFWGNVWVRTRSGQVFVKKTGSRWKLVGIRWHEELTAVAKCFLGAKVIKSLNKKENSKMFKPQEFLCKL